MRHDTHFVDQLARPEGAPVGRLVPLKDIDANPNQPRQSLGDLSELVASIREKGVIEPILVRPKGRRFEIIAGERRFRAATEAGLAEIPSIIREVSDGESMELALIENLQRKDLNAFEEADGLNALAESYGYTHEQMAERLGKSRTSITESLSLGSMPDQVRQLCRLADIQSKSLLLQIVRQSDPEKMAAFVQKLQRGVVTRDEARRLASDSRPRPKGRPRNYVYRFQSKERGFTLALTFRRSHVPREDVVGALEAVLDELAGERSRARSTIQ
jgi:ParB family chromosome partitioning protein